MKPSFNVIRGRTDRGVAGFRWCYRERKVGRYLTLHCPRRKAEPPADRRVNGGYWYGWETSLSFECPWKPDRHRWANGEMRIDRETRFVHAESGRNVPRYGIRYDKSVADLRVRADLLGTIRHHAFHGVPHAMPATTEEHIEPDAVADLIARFAAVVDGCAAQGRFDVAADWLVENAPACVARLFDTPATL